MIYTLAQGTQGYNSRLHYSLYGGAEYYPERTFAWKELLPLAAIPVVVVALLTALLNFHVPNVSPTIGGAHSGSQSNGHKTYSLVLSPGSNSGVIGSSKTAGARSNSPSTTSPNTNVPGTFSQAQLVPLSPNGSDNGQGIIGGMGGGTPTGTGTGGGTTTVTDPTGTTTTSTSSGSGGTTLSASATTPVSQTSTSTSLNTSSGTAQVGVDVFLAPTNTSLSTSTSLGL